MLIDQECSIRNQIKAKPNILFINEKRNDEHDEFHLLLGLHVL